MSKIKYKHIDLDGATLVQRRHKRQLTPPGMWSVDNMFLSRSDNNPALRPDLKTSAYDIYAISSDTTVQESAGIPDIVNSMSGIYGSSSLVWFTSYIPWLAVNGKYDIGSASYSTGVAVGRSGYFDVDFYAFGASPIELYRETWRGALLELNSDGSYYVVDKVIASTPSTQVGTLYTTAPLGSSYTGEVDLLAAAYKWTASGSGTNEYYCEAAAGGDPGLSEAREVLLDDTSITKGTLGSLTDHQWGWGDNDTLGYNTVYVRDDTGDPDVSGVTLVSWPGVSYKLYYNHNCFRAAFNKIDIQQNGNYMFYATPGISAYMSPVDISGPFYGQGNESDWWYGGKKYYHLESDFGNTEYNEFQYTLAVTGLSSSVIWFKAPYKVDDTDSSDSMWLNGDTASAGEINENNSWTPITSATWTGKFARSVQNQDDFNTALIGTSFDADGNQYGYNSLGGAHKDTGYDSPWQSQSMVWDLTTYTCLLWNSSTNEVNLRYSTDSMATWNDTTTNNTWTGTEYSKIKYDNSYFVVAGGDGKVYYSTDGQDFSSYDISSDVAAMDNVVDIAYNNGNNGGYWMAVNGDDEIARCSTLNGTWTSVTPTYPETPGAPTLNFIHYDARGARFVLPSEKYIMWSDDDGTSWTFQSMPDYYWWSPTAEPSNVAAIGAQLAIMRETAGAPTGDPIEWLVLDRDYIATWYLDTFQPVSKVYRANSVAVLDGYTVLIGTREFEGTGDAKEWNYYPRRVRWSVSGSPVDFTSTGSGSGDLRGAGALLRGVPVNGRIVIFETVAVGALVPRGDSSDPWDYDIIDENFSFLSNPCVVDDVCYIIGVDGLLYQTDGIGSMKEVGASFDLTEFSDFDEKTPAWLTYSRKMNSLLCYYRDTSQSTHPMYVINLANGGVSEIDLLELSDSNDRLVEVPGSVFTVENSHREEDLVSYHPHSDDTNSIITPQLRFGDQITGNDVASTDTDPDQEEYWYGMLETGELFIEQEGQKAAIKHLIIETYTDNGDSDNTGRPYIAVEVKSIEDSDYAPSGDSVGTATMTSTALTGSGTAWSTTIAGPNAGSTQQKCNGSTTDFTLPCLGSQARVYLDSTLQTSGTDYTSSGKTISFTTAPGATKTLYAYWENYPEVKVKTGDYFKSSEGWHRVTAISSAQDITLDHYLSTGSETVTHYPAWQMDDGHGRVEIGINRLVEGVQIKLHIIPDYVAESGRSKIAKITGLSIGYVPQGRKTLKATGS